MQKFALSRINVNIPDVDSADAIKGRKITALSHSQIARPVHHVVDPRGRDAYWLSLRKRQRELLTDDASIESAEIQMMNDQAVAAGYISVSPVRLHHTPTETLASLSALVL